MKISRPFSALIAALVQGYITAVLCGVCGIREWGALFVVVCVGGITGAGVFLIDQRQENLANHTPHLASVFRDEVPKLPDINQDPLAVEINEAARRAGLILTQREISKIPGWSRGRIVEVSIHDVSIVEPPHGHPKARPEQQSPKERIQTNDLEPPL